MLAFKFFILFFAVYFTHADVSFPKDHCVAWKTKKTMFLFKKLEPVGISCEVTTTILKDEDGEPFLKVEVPIKSFDSGETKRDLEVVRILKADKQANLIFKTSEAFKIYDTKKDFGDNFSGELIIGGAKNPVNFRVFKIKKDGKFFYKGKATLKYTDLNISPPSVAGGAVAKVKDYLELHFRFSHDKINVSL